MNEIFHIFTDLQKYHSTEMVFDPSDLMIDESKYQRRVWTSSEFGHVQGKQDIPRNMSQPRGIGVIVRVKVDTDHVSDTVTRRSITSFLVYISSTLTYWFSKKKIHREFEFQLRAYYDEALF